MTVHRAVKLIGASLELHFQFGALAGLYLFGFLLDAFSLDLQGVDGVAGVHGLKHVSAGLAQRDLGRLQLEQATWSEANRIEQVAGTRLGMKFPEDVDIVVLEP